MGVGIAAACQQAANNSRAQLEAARQRMGQFGGLLGQVGQKVFDSVRSYYETLQDETDRWLGEINLSKMSFKDELQDETNKWLNNIK